VRPPGGAEQCDKFGEFFLRQMAQLPSVALANGIAQLAEQGEAGLRDADADDPAVIGRINEGRLLLDVLTVSDEELPELTAAVRAVLA